MFSFFRHLAVSITLSLSTLFGGGHPMPSPAPGVATLPIQGSVSPTPTSSKPIHLTVALKPSFKPTPTPPKPKPTPTPKATAKPTPKVVIRPEIKLMDAFLKDSTMQTFEQLCTKGASLHTLLYTSSQALSTNQQSLVATKQFIPLGDLLPECGLIQTARFVGTGNQVAHFLTAPLYPDDAAAYRLKVLQYNSIVDKLTTNGLLILNRVIPGSGTKFNSITFSILVPEPGIKAVLTALNVTKPTALTATAEDKILASSFGSKISIYASAALNPTVWFQNVPWVH